ncbi:DUF6443 domain-containing protein [Flagellimonas sp. S3867]|uniref:DUF6443 domain-containing protein n=1 Tax=Flagellimonas sp. S3867 TaxID=2768063 RepID=UPI0016827611|nr:DUF6443 domain-containing protein [Flagellimonas sp. S3867]
MKKINSNQNKQHHLLGLLAMVICMLMTTGLKAQTINGPSTVNQGSTYGYTLSHGSSIIFMVWIAPGGTITSSGNTYANVRWDQSGNKSLIADFQDPYNFYTITKNVTVNATAPSTPSTPSVSSNGCGQAVLSRGTPPGGVTWFWQTSSSGTSLANSSSTYTVTSTGTYYLRARNSGGTWSSSSSSRYVGIINLTAGVITNAQTICYSGNPSTLGNFEGAGGTSGSFNYQWQYSNNGSSGWTNISGATGTTYNPPGGLTASRWYRRRVICASQTKYTNSIKVTVRANLAAGSIGGTQTICYNGNPGNLHSSTSASGGDGSYSYQWQYSNNGSSGWTNISGATSTAYNPPSGLTADRWYRRRAISCGQTKYTGGVKVTVASTPGTPSSPSVTNNCGNTVLTRGTPPSGITWYWQSSSSGTSTSNSSTTVTRTSGTTYYLRGRNSTGCWGSSRTISYSVTQPTTWYADTDGDGKGNSAASTSGCSQPSGYVSNSSDHDDTTVMITDIAPQTYYKDADGDGFGVSSPTIYASFKPLGYATNSTDQCPDSPGTTNGCDYVSPTLSDENYVYTRSYQSAMSAATGIKKNRDVLESVAYFDGLGRAKQQVAVRASGTATRASSPNTPPEWTMDWTTGTGGTPFFNKNGTTAENERIQGPNPFGETDLIWRCGNEPDYGSDGGWNTDYINVDKTKTYRYMVWVRRDQSQDGKTYHGTQNVDNLGGGANTNPYFWSGDMPQLSEWYLLVGIIHPYTHGSTDTGVSGVYDMNGAKVIDGTEYKWGSGTTTSRFRSYLYYSTDVNVRQYFYRPILEIVDGNEIPLSEMFETGKAEDIVTHVSYDNYGRQDKEWLPYHEPTGNYGSYRGDVATPTQQYYQNNYADDFIGLSTANVNAYAEKEFEPSPLNRVLEQAAPGKDWKLGNGHEIRFDYKSNAANEVRRYKVTLSFANNTYTPTLVADGHYAANELYKSVTKDENWTSGTDHTTEEFTDKQGRVVLKRTHNSGDHDTYYVYDDYGNLTYVLPPKVVHDSSISATELSELCYQYVYDFRNRLVEKKIPGKGWEYIVYDKLDRPIMTQDPYLDAQNKWLFTKYDAFGRVAYTGLSNATTSSRTALQNTVNGLSTQYVTKSGSSIVIAGTTIYYNNGVYPTGISEVHTINYYDSYVDTNGLNVPANVLGQTTVSGNDLKGLATVSKVRVLTTSDWTTTITGYDSKRRPVYTASKNNYLNTVDAVLTELDFASKAIQVKTDHTMAGQSTLTTTNDFTYDHAARLLKQEQTIGANTETLVENHYDGLGQLITKETGGGLQHVDYNYNVRGWLKQINDPDNLGTDLFAFSMEYNDLTDVSKRLYNGNIGKTNWITASVNSSGNPVSNTYTYTYDALNRITSATENTNNYYVTGIEYDKNGNLTKLKRKGVGSLIDDLHYTYYDNQTSNRLQRVSDSAGNTEGFNDGASATTEYTYDTNGNMITDSNKGITAITYNHLNLPTSVTMGAGTISYIYDAAGTKLKKTAGSSVTEYANGYVYSGTTSSTALQFFNHPEGYVYKDGSAYKYVYQYKDHLGNIRLSYEDGNDNGSVDQSEIVEENNYYPFGLKHKGYNSGTSPLGNSVANRWKYGGKELDDSFNDALATYDFGARNYSPDLGRWMNIDPLAEKYMPLTPYNYVGNNPNLYVDETGEDFAIYLERNENGDWQIRIAATYYVKTGDEDSKKSAEAAVKAWSNKTGYSLQIKDENKNKSQIGIVFDLNVVEVDNPQSEKDKDVRGDDDAKTKDGSSNIYSVVSEHEIKSKSSHARGVTTGLYNILVPDNDPGIKVGAHEIGHTLGLDDKGSGIMAGGNDTSISQWDVQDIIEFAEKTKKAFPNLNKVSVHGKIPKGHRKNKVKPTSNNIKKYHE